MGVPTRSPTLRCLSESNVALLQAKKKSQPCARPTHYIILYGISFSTPQNYTEATRRETQRLRDLRRRGVSRCATSTWNIVQLQSFKYDIGPVLNVFKLFHVCLIKLR
jgi:hypothetical protein